MVDVNISIDRASQERLNALLDGRLIRRVIVRALSRARSDIGRLYVRHLKREIRGSVRRRTGALLRIKLVRSSIDRNLSIRLLPTFPATAYETPRNRGRRNASKRGQYAFVLNSSRDFIGEATRKTASDPRLLVIINKHLAFVLAQVLREGEARS